ncbi:hypothetical protein EV673_0385 [Limnobacter thiooxidans]|uniref:Uncharacterized protein n=1 Tax=Limnobacter thiooxidans TaxID=131080 RepID=A0AA86M8R7_9BURK|nr:hypothetical protein EV673_0385 [Limnobacter thiooxidans]BET26504.1 hypothetical protein RGQ30_20050 [Limnobacter thiooxidans]
MPPNQKIAVPLDWLWPLKIRQFIPELHRHDFEDIDRKVRTVLSPVFALIPELAISGALQTRLNPHTQRVEVFYQPVLISAKQYQLPFDDHRSEKLEAILKSCLEEFNRLPLMLEMLLKAQELKPLKSLSPQEYQALSVLRALLDLRLPKESFANNHSLKLHESKGPDTEHQLSFQAKVEFKGRQSVMVHSVRWNKTNAVIVNRRKFEVQFRQTHLLDDGDEYLNRFEQLLLSERTAQFVCRVTLQERNGKRKVKNAFLERLIDE